MKKEGSLWNLHKQKQEGPNQPSVTIKKGITKKLGEATIDYGKLDALFEEGLGIPPEKTPKVILRGGILLADTKGHHFFGTNRITVNPVATEHLHNKDPKKHTIHETMEAIIHEGQHRADFVNHPIRTVGEKVLGLLPFAAGEVLYNALTSGDLSEMRQKIGGLAAGYALNQLWYKTLDPSERRARAAEKDPKFNKYKDAIVFKDKPPEKDPPMLKETPIIRGF